MVRNSCKENLSFKRRDLEQDQDHKGGTFLVKNSWIKTEKRREIGQREEGGQREERHK